MKKLQIASTKKQINHKYEIPKNKKTIFLLNLDLRIYKYLLDGTSREKQLSYFEGVTVFRVRYTASLPFLADSSS